jgi:hypothetical protein
MGEKVFMMVLLEAWNACITNGERSLPLVTVENYVNTGIFGTDKSRSQWKVPINKENKIEAISFIAWGVKKILAWLSNLVAQLQLEGDRKTEWQHMLSCFST